MFLSYLSGVVQVRVADPVLLNIELEHSVHVRHL